MSDAIEKMKEEGWKQKDVSDAKLYPELEILCFSRPRQKPNAIVDWESLNDYLQRMESPDPKQNRPFDVFMIRQYIKKVDP